MPDKPQVLLIGRREERIILDICDVVAAAIRVKLGGTDTMPLDAALIRLALDKLSNEYEEQSLSVEIEYL
jgi:hypothetical protein